MWSILAAVILVAAGIAAWTLWQRQMDRPMSQPIPLTTYQGTQTQPAFSPDGNQIAFTWDGEKQDNWDIYVKVMGSETPLRLTTDPAPDISPAWSPDGRAIAFVRVSSPGKFELMLIPPLGGPERKLGEFGSPVYAANGGHLMLPTWSADSKWLVVGSALPDSNEVPLFKVSVESGEATQITHPGGTLGDFWPQISPDGKTLLFTRRAPNEFGDLYELALDGNADPVGQPRAIPSGSLPIGPANWISGGQTILFVTVGGVFRIPATGSDMPERIPVLGYEALHVGLSRSGDRLAYAMERGDANIWRIDLTAKPAHPERLIASTFRDAYPQYSPDGKRIAFYSDRGGSTQIWMGDAEGEQSRQLTFVQSEAARTPHWSPDGKTLVLDSDVSGAYQVYTMSAEGGKMTQLTQGPAANFAATWSRDGRWIYFASNRTRRNEIWKMPAEGGTATQITHAGGVKALESFDGRTIYFDKEGGSGSIWKMPVEGGAETKLVDSLYRINFALGKQGIYYMSAPGIDDTSALMFYSFATGTSSTILQMGFPAYGLDISPDGRYLIYGQLDSPGSNLMLVEHFH
jgi:Tol biopolymer transport system component